MLLLVVVGTGLPTGNMAAQAGALYDAADHRRVRAYALSLAALNVGAPVARLADRARGLPRFEPEAAIA